MGGINAGQEAGGINAGQEAGGIDAGQEVGGINAGQEAGGINAGQEAGGINAGQEAGGIDAGQEAGGIRPELCQNLKQHFTAISVNPLSTKEQGILVLRACKQHTQIVTPARPRGKRALSSSQLQLTHVHSFNS